MQPSNKSLQRFLKSLGPAVVRLLTLSLSLSLLGAGRSPAQAADITWLAPVDGDWSEGTNWTGGVSPGALDTAIIDVVGSFRITLDANTSVAKVRLGGASGAQELHVSGATLTVSDSLTVSANGTLDVTNGEVAGGGVLDNSGHARLLGSATIQNLSNQGRVSAAAPSNTVTTFTSNAGSELIIDPGIVATNTDLTITNGFVNHGTIDIVQTNFGANYFNRLDVTSGSLTNAFDGNVRSPLGNARGIRSLNAQIVNNGTITIDYPLTVAREDSDHINNSAINVVGGDLTITQTGASPSFANNGNINIADTRTFTLDGGTLNYDPGSTTGLGTFRVSNVTGLGGTTLPANSADFFLAGNNLINSIDNSARVQAGAANNTITTFTSNAGSELVVDAGLIGAHSDLTITSGFVNHGTIDVVQTAFGASFLNRLDVTNGNLTNAFDGNVRSPLGNARGIRSLNAQIVNNGTITIDYPLTIAREDSDHANNSAINVVGGDLTVTQTGASPSFANNGNIDIADTRTFTLDGGTLNYDPGSTTGLGTFRVSNVTGLGGTTLSANSADFFLAGNNLINSIDNSARVQAGGASNTITTFTSNAGSELVVDPGLIGAHSDLTITNGFVNHGTIDVVQTAFGASFFNRLDVTNGNLTNAFDGNVRCPLGNARGIRNLNAQIVNNGTITVDYPLTIAREDSDHVNNSAINVVGGDLTVTQSGASPSFANNGNIDIAAARTFTLDRGTLNYDPGSTTGLGTFRVSNVTGLGGTTLPANSADFFLAGNNLINSIDNSARVQAGGASNTITTFTSNPGSELVVDPGLIGAHSDLTITNGFVNHGTIDVVQTAFGASFFNRLDVTNGNLTNAFDGNVRSPLGNARGIRNLNAQIVNNGTITVDYPLTIAREDSDHVNNSAINVVGGDLTVTQTGTNPSFANNGNIDIADNRTFTLNGGTLNYDPGSTTGLGTFRVSNVTGLGGTTLPANSADFFLAGNNLINSIDNSARVQAGGASNTITTFTSNPGSELAVDPGLIGAHSDLTITNGFVNHGTIDVVQTAFGASFFNRLDVTNGNLTNAFDGNVRCPLGNARGFRNLNAQIVNNGTITIDYPLTVARDDSDHVNNSAINVVGGNLTVTQTGASPSFANNGNIDIADTRTFTLDGGTLNYDPGSTTGLGTFRISNVTGLGGTTLPANSAVFFLAGNNLIDSIDNSARVQAGAANNTITTFTSNAGSELVVDPGLIGAHSDLTITNGFVNHGTIDVVQTAFGASFLNRLDVTNGNLTNAFDGNVRCPLGNARGFRNLNAQIVNNGTITIDYPLTVARDDSDHVNNSAINVVGGDLTVTQTGASPSFANNGNIDIADTRTFTLDGGTLNYDPGSTTGLGTFRVSNVTGLGGTTLPANSAVFFLAGNNLIDSIDNSARVLSAAANNTITTFTSNAGSELIVDPGLIGTNSDLAITNGFVNHGTIHIVQTAFGASFFNRLEVTSGKVTNAFDGTIACPLGNGRGVRSIDAQVTNAGLVRIDYPLTATGGPIVNEPTGTLQGSSTFDVSAVSFTNDGTTIPGASPGTLTIVGDDSRSATSALNLEIGGTTAGSQHDQLEVTAIASLDGALNVTLLNDFEPALGDSFFVVTAGTRLGEFATTTGLKLPNGLQFDVDYRSDAVVLRAGDPPANTPPVAVADSATTNEDTLVDIIVLTNDFDADGDSVTVVPGAFSDPAHGTVSLNVDQSVRFIPDPNFFGTDSFTYVITDGRGANDTTTVHVDVLPVNDPPQFVAPTPGEGTSISVLPGDLFQFDVTAIDVDSTDVVTLDAQTLPAGATMTPALPTNGNPVTSQLLWFPTASDIGEHLVHFTAVDDSGATAERMFTLIVEMPTSTVISRLRAQPTPDGVEILWEIVGGSTIREQQLERSDFVTGPWDHRNLPVLDAWSERALDRTATFDREFFYRLRVTTQLGDELIVGPVSASGLGALASFELTAPSPNPSRSTIQAQFSVATEGPIAISVFDVTGRRVATLAEGNYAPGIYHLTWDGIDGDRTAAPGVYFLKYVARGESASHKFVRVR